MDKTSSFSSHEGKPIRCKAAICRKAGEALVIEEIHVYPPQAYEVRIKIICTTLCHTDLAFSKYNSGPVVRFPRILGHEAVGVVESIGEHVDGFKQGDVVLPVFHPHCEECRDCKSSKGNWCTRFAEDIVSELLENTQPFTLLFQKTQPFNISGLTTFRINWKRHNLPT
ncbi:hypothetical protein HID58_001213 [Brassica napus]|uniref:Alcohol dehydrogenase-like N-terminal domain-containing protein n=1 Tax=Brassica napus TaxID=3708 RepID=A0ABQ8EJ09_BRANA|nr:hypothetical protein HID58_001213 [Brassica napus]